MREGWEISTLGKACQIKPPKKEAKARLSPTDPVSFVPMNDLGIGEKSFAVTQARPLEVVSGSYTYFADGDVLLAKITPCFENGKLGIASGLVNGVGFGSSEFIVFRPGKSIVPEYLFYFLSQDSFRDAGAAVMSGAVGHKRVPKEFVQGYPIPLPPLPEQKRIVAILDEAFAGIATAIANTEKNLANAHELFASVCKSTFEVDGKSWPKKPLGTVCDNLDSKRVPITKAKRVPGDVPYYGASGIVDYVKGYIFDEDLLLVSEDGANLLARAYPIAFSISGKSWVNNHAHVLRFEHYESQRFIEYFLNSISFAPFVSGMAQPKLNQKALNSILVPFPEFPEQCEAVEKLDSLAEATRGLESIYGRELAALGELKQALLQKAYSGELTADFDKELEAATA